jgi:uncharacterized membrane protein YfcA
MDAYVAYVLLLGAGLIAGTLNVIAGGGSFLTLPVLIFLGLPATVANGTNRVGILVQNVGAVWSFHRHRVLDWRSFLWAALPSSLGAALGVWIALEVGDQTFQRVLAFLMVGVTIWTILDPVGRIRRRSTGSEFPKLYPLAIGTGFFFVGIYGGFVQAGVGFFVLAVTTWAGLDLVRGNAVKVLSILVFTVLSLAIFSWQGMVQWIPGLVLAAGTFLGGQIGVKFTVLKGHDWVKGFVIVAVIIFAVKLWAES